MSGWALTPEAAKQSLKSRQHFDNGPDRFYLKAGKKANIIVLDASFDSNLASTKSPVYLMEYEIPYDKNGKFAGFKHVVCTKTQYNEDPLEGVEIEGAVREPDTVLYISILDLTQYQNTNGETVKCRRKLLRVKNTQIERFSTLLAAAQKKYGQIRGFSFVLERPDDSKSSKIGEPKPYLETMEFKMYTEKELIAEFGNPEIKGKDGKKVVLAKNEQVQPFNYEKLFKKTPAEVREMMGLDDATGTPPTHNVYIGDDDSDNVFDDDVDTAVFL